MFSGDGVGMVKVWSGRVDSDNVHFEAVTSVDLFKVNFEIETTEWLGKPNQ
jgi:hypothetical protein